MTRRRASPLRKDGESELNQQSNLNPIEHLKQHPKATPQWNISQVAVLVASGPSLKQSDVDYVRGKARVLVVNDSYRLAPWADCLYACDPHWWDHHEGVPDFQGQKWTQSLKAAQKFDLRFIPGDHRKGLALDGGLIHYGGNSGYQALNLAVLFGARKILLLGYDMQHTGGKAHWFGEHPERLRRPSPFKQFISAFNSSVSDLDRAGVTVINCSAETALTCFPRAELRETLRHPYEIVA